MGWTKKLQLQDADYKQIESMAAMGITIEQMAGVLNVAKKTFENEIMENQRLKETIEGGRAKGVTKVTGYLWEHIEKRDKASIFFYLKCRGGWKETVNVETKGGS